MDFVNLLTSLKISSLGLNWIDVIVLVILLFYSIEGYFLGFFAAFIDAVSFTISFILGIAFYAILSKLLLKTFAIPAGFTNAISFFIIAIVTEIIISIILKALIENLTSFSFKNKSQNVQNYFKIVSQIFGIIPGLILGLLLSAFILSLIISLPFSVFLKHSVTESKIGNLLVANTQSFAKDWSNVFGGAVNETLSFLTIEPKSNESLNLNFKTTKVSVDNSAEQKMFNLVNQERASRGISVLTFSEELAKVGRAHCKDMLARGYFSHYTPDKLTPFDRMAAANIYFNYAGENLALAPNTDLAMNGLMQSPGHKANILEKNFGKIGVGVIDGGIYGEMFCQEFTD
jgi:uncharacterized protein YkwD